MDKKDFMNEVIAHQGIVKRICRIYQKGKSDQEDLYQDIVLNAWQAFPRFEGRSKFSTWLYRVALNTAISQVRKNRMLRNWVDVEQAAAVEDTHTDDEEILILLRAIYRLDPLEKGIVILYLDGLTYRDIGEVTGLSESNVGVRINRIKSKLKVILANNGLR